MSETLRDLVVSLSLNSDNFTRNIKSINKQIQEAESAFRLASAGVENFETTTVGLSSKLSTLQRTFQLQQDAVGQYERALQQASDKLQECYIRQNDYAQRLTDAKDKQQQLKTEVASAAQAYRHYKNTLGETDSATIAAKANLDAYKGEYRAAVQEVKKLEGQNVALKKSTQNAADAFSAAQTKLNGAKGAVKETAAEINQCNRQLALSRTSWASAGEAIQASQRSIASIGKQMKTAESSYRLAAAGVKDFDKSAAGLTAKLTLLQEKLGLQCCQAIYLLAHVRITAGDVVILYAAEIKHGRLLSRTPRGFRYPCLTETRLPHHAPESRLPRRRAGAIRSQPLVFPVLL